MSSTHVREVDLPSLEVIERALLRQDLLEYVAGAWPIVEPGTVYKPNWHIECVADHLEAVSRGEIRNLIINVPPRHMKSLLVGVFWPTWVWTWWPESRWLFASYDGELSIRDNLKARRVMQSPWYQARWPDVEFAPDQNLKGRYENTRTGFRVATSPGGMGTGEGGDFLVADDPHNVKQAESDDVRQGTVNWWRETMSTRLNDPSTGRKVIVMQRVHAYDVVGYALETGNYHHLCLPARYEPRVVVQTGMPPQPQPHDDAACDLDPALHPHRLDPRSEESELLWKAHFTPEALAELERELGPYGTAGQLQQRPVPRSGALFTDGAIAPLPAGFDTPDEKGTTRRERLIKVQYLDLAWKDKESNDYTVALTLGYERATGNCFVLHVLRFRASDEPEAEGSRRLDMRIADNVEITKPHLLIFEEGAFQQRATKDLMTRVARLLEHRHACGVAVIRPAKDKVARAQVPVGRANAGQLYADTTAPWWSVFLRECLDFPKSAHDDQVDALSGAMQGAIEKAGVVGIPSSQKYSVQGGTQRDDHSKQLFAARK